MQNLVHGFDAHCLCFEGLVLLDELQQGGFLVGLEYGLHVVEPEGLDLCALLCCYPFLICAERCQGGVPFGLGDAVLLGEHQRLHLCHCGLPGGVHAFHEREHSLGVGPCDGVEGDVFALCGEVLCGDGLDLLYVHVNCTGGVGVEADELAAHEEVGYLGGDCLNCC